MSNIKRFMELFSIKHGHSGQINDKVVDMCIETGCRPIDEDQQFVDRMAERACGVPQPNKEKKDLPF